MASRHSAAAGGGCFFLCDDGLADRGDRAHGELEVLDSERNADDGRKRRDGGRQVAEAEPETTDDEPNYIADEPDRAGSNIRPARQLLPIDRFAAERKKTKFAKHEAGARPRNTDNRDRRQNTGQPPAETQEDTAKDTPDEV